MIRLIISVGNSNNNGVEGVAGAPAGLPITDVKFYRWHGDSTASTFRTVGAVESADVTNTTNFASHVPQCTYHCQMAKDLDAGAWGSDTVINVMVGVNGSLLFAFRKGGLSKYFQRIQAVTAAARGLITGPFKAYLDFTFGENERSDAIYGPKIGADMIRVHSDIKEWLGVDRLYKIGTRLRTGLGTYNATIRTQQENFFNGDDGLGYINTDDVSVDGAGTYGAVDVHFLVAGHNTIGSRKATLLNAHA